MIATALLYWLFLDVSVAFPTPRARPRVHPGHQSRSALDNALDSTSSSSSGTSTLYLPSYSQLSSKNHDLVTIRRRDGRILPIPQQKRYQSREWLSNLCNMYASRTLKRIRSPVVGISVWSGVFAALQWRFFPAWTMTTMPHTLLGSTLGLLLTFRTNAAYNRFWEGRTIWQSVVDKCRDLARLSAAYADVLGSERYIRVCNLICTFPLMLEYHLEGRRGASRFLREDMFPTQPRVRDDEDSESAAAIEPPQNASWSFSELQREERQLARHYAFKATQFEQQPASGERAETKSASGSALEFEPFMPKRGLNECANRPLFVANALTHEFRGAPDSNCGFFTNRERVTLIEKVNALASSIGACERLVQTPVPLSYARHTSRFLSLWCLTLPLPLAPLLGPVLTPAAICCITWGLFGIQEIGLWIEDPFKGELELSVLSDTIFCDVSETANYFTRQPKTAAPDNAPQRDARKNEQEAEIFEQAFAAAAALGVAPDQAEIFEQAFAAAAALGVAPDQDAPLQEQPPKSEQFPYQTGLRPRGADRYYQRAK